MMSKLKIIISLLLTVLLLFSFSSVTFAYEYGVPDLTTMIKTEKHGNRESRFISGRDVNRIRISKCSKYKNKSDKEKLKEIFTALELDVSTQKFDKISENLSLSDIENISTDTIYIKTDDNGVQTEVDKEEALKAAAEEEIAYSAAPAVAAASDTRPTISHSKPYPEKSPDGYMEQQITAIYTPNYHGVGTTPGRYVIWGDCKWLTTPSRFQRGEDVISLFANDEFDWKNKGADGISNYMLLASYDRCYYDEKTGITTSVEPDGDFYEEDKAVVSVSDGVYFKYDLPNNGVIGPMFCRNFEFTIIGICNVHNYDDTTQFLSMGLRYIHMKNTASASVSVSWKSAGVSVSSYHMPIYYDVSHSWDYKTDFYA